MKSVLALLLLLITSPVFPQSSINDFFEDTDSFLKKYIQSGNVNYNSIANNKTDIEALATSIEAINPDLLKSNERKAFLINAYNILVIKSVVDHYPISSPMDVSGFFDQLKHNVGSYEWTLNHIENNVLRPEYKDARLHFVLVCGAKSCPPITDFAYLPQKLDNQLTQQTALAINDNTFIRVNDAEQKVEVSEIFKWYSSDFKLTHNNALDYINNYRKNNISKKHKYSYYPYNWALNESRSKNPKASSQESTIHTNVQTFTPSILLKKGQFDIQLFNNVYTQTQFRDGNRELQDVNGRQNYYGGLFSVLYGLTNSRKVNIGVDINLKSVHIDSDKSSSPFLFFGSADPFNRTALASVGPKIKIAPFNQIKFSLQSAFWIPVADDLEADENWVVNSTAPVKPWLDYNRYTWWNQFFFDKNLGAKFQLFTEFDLLFRFAKPTSSYPGEVEKNNQLVTPASVFISYFPSNKSTIYSMIQHAPTFENAINDSGDEVFSRTADYTQAGVGTKYQLTPQLGLEILYTRFFQSLNGGAGSTINLGIRFITK